MSEVLKVIHNDRGQVVLEVNANDPLTVAMHPYVQSNWKYITVGKGRKHVLTVVRTDGTSFSFHWGEGGYTLISEGLEQLRKKVVETITDNYIWLDWIGDEMPDEINIFYNSNFRAWEMTARNTHNRDAYWFSKGNSWEDVAFEVEQIFPDLEKIEWRQGIAQTGIPIWRAVL